ncbi:MAG: hypothetical protein CR984_07295, partial [Proteobacteria bacterium]
TLCGKRPYEDIDIQFTGLRPGEKMYEELFNTGESLTRTAHPRIRAAVSTPVDKDEIDLQVQKIADLIRQYDRAGLMQAFFDLVPGHRADKEAADALRRQQDISDPKVDRSAVAADKNGRRASPDAGKGGSIGVRGGM